MIYFVLFILIIVAIKIAHSKHICKLGFHDTEDIKHMNLFKYIESAMRLQRCWNGLDVFKIYQRSIYMDLYEDPRSRKYGWLDKTVSDSVCVKCHKCILRIDKEKEIITETVIKYSEKIRQENHRKQLAKDIYNDNCKGNNHE